MTKIGNRAFMGCFKFKQINLPEDIIEIGEWDFSYCNSLTQINIPNSMAKVGDRTFYNCENFKLIGSLGNKNIVQELI